MIHSQAARLLEKEWKAGVRLRLIGVGVGGLVHGRQLSLFDAPTEKLGKLSRAVDQIRSKYGRDAIQRASLLEVPEERDDRASG